jgi:uncharacterized membrane protein YidH (DUF202 family)
MASSATRTVRERSPARGGLRCSPDAASGRPVLCCGLSWESAMVESAAKPPPDLIDYDPGAELSASRTGLSFERTGMSTDRTLMSTVRTSLSLIGFGFTICQVLGKASGVLPGASETARYPGRAANYHMTPTYVSAVALLVIGLAAITIIIFRLLG